MLRQKRNNGTTGRHTPPRCIEKRRMAQRGGVHLLIALKREEQHNGEEYTSSLRRKRKNGTMCNPLHCVEKIRTAQQGGVHLLIVSKREERHNEEVFTRRTFKCQVGIAVVLSRHPVVTGKSGVKSWWSRIFASLGVCESLLPTCFAVSYLDEP